MPFAHVALVVAGALLGAVAASAQDAPAQVRIGDDTVALAAQTTRERWFVDLYRIALYATTPTPTPNGLRAEAPKALRIEVLYGGDMPQSIPAQWKDELMPALSDNQVSRLRRAYAGLDEGDVVLIEYAPPIGTRILVNDRTVVSDPGEGPMQAFLDIFIGRDPISADLKRALID